MWNKINLKLLDEAFLKFANGYISDILIGKRASLEPLTSEEIIEASHYLEDFLIFYFKIDLSLFRSKLEMWQKMVIVKREFIQRKVALKYKDFEGIEPDFISEEEFTLKALKVLSLEKEEELVQYARFALFTEKGKGLHKNGMLFKLPFKIALPFSVSENNQIIYPLKEGEDSFKKTPEQNFSHAKYCIYCHKQQKDYCRKGNPSASKNGCPLDQKISEMNLLKAEGGLISPLACMMIDNPLCILTGDRICNDCKKACIFQKQEQVDVPSIESQILKDVLALPFGFEIYYLLTQWNPLLTSNFLPKPYNGKKVLVCGAGPAGIANAYYFTREGYEVTMIEGLKVQNISEVPALKDFLKKPIKNAYTILNLPSEKRMKGGFGGVMEYGITSRFNKNLLSLCQILLERNPLFKLYGGKKFGTEITLEGAKKLGFFHVLMCIGAGNPHLPSFENEGFVKQLQASLKEGSAMTASNFLMSSNLEENWGKRKILSPVVILGGGLTAIDCALQAREFLGNEVEITIFIRRELQNSPSFKLNEVEVEDALSKGVKIFQNRNLKEIKKEEVTFDTEESFPFKTLVFAFGTEPNLTYLKESSDFCTFFGDLDKNYEGSVVKALASAKLKKDEILKKLSEEKVKNIKIPDFSSKVVSLNEISKGFYKLEATFPFKAKPLEVFKLQSFNNNFHSIPLTLFNSENGVLTFYFKKFGLATSEICTLKKGDGVSLMKATSFEEVNFERIFTEDPDFLNPLQNICKNVFLVKDFIHKPDKKTLFYLKEFDFSSIPYSKNYYKFLFGEMNCMLSGVCSRCLKINENGLLEYTCFNNIRSF